ncbi:MarR family transcriptional regulator [Streptacidiphilus sp. PB12-B1b]|uniref:MarR family winged helix-turn-helix transcriptional regulator n=1 Tax=Streptacidiphilus sp. PB12-B1b TaxID=2705012 RepID=UPI0015FE47D2|nr:MarR family transcriptional regulator [Streptacidiphilus sp. PB12-B1b]QMU76520.1 MarR family transcriptional regulator [Streptacidiphilus sp. PB12-B1b]
MTDDHSAREDDPARTRRDIVDALRRYSIETTRLGHAFSARNGLQSADLEALLAVLGAQRAGAPLTPGALRRHLGLSSGGTSLVIDRLERAGHLRRTRDHPSDNRIVHLRHTEQGRATGSAFFGPLAERTDAVLAQFDPRELAAIQRFVTAAAETTQDYLADLEARPPQGGGATAPG